MSLSHLIKKTSARFNKQFILSNKYFLIIDYLSIFANHLVLICKSHKQTIRYKSHLKINKLTGNNAF